MSSLTERLQFILSADSSSAIKGFQAAGDSADKELGKAESKLDKVGGNMTKFGAGAMAMAGVAGAALFTTATKFGDLGIEAGKFSDTTGLAVDDASRWIEVSGDMGIEAGTLEASLNKMNVTAGKTPQKFADFGVEIARTKTGAVDVNQTFLNTIDRLNAIEDPAKKAEAATTLLGKGWTGMSELIETGSGTLTASLAAVSDSKVINPDELQKAKDLRAAMDTLKDSGEDLALSIGQSVAPMVAGLASGIGGAVQKVADFDVASGGMVGTVLGVGTAVLGAAGAISFIAGQTLKMKGRFTDAEGGLNNFGKAAKGAGIALGVLGTAVAAIEIIDQLTGKTGDASASLTSFIATSGRVKGTAGDWAPLVNSAGELANKIYDTTGTLDNFTMILGEGLDQSSVNLNNLSEAFDQILGQSPEAAAQLVKAFTDAQAAADAGNASAKNWLDTFGVGSSQIADFRTKVVDTADAQDTLAGSTNASGDAVRKLMGETGPYLSEIGAVAEATDAATAATADHKVEIEANKKAMEAAKQAVEDHTKSLEDDIAQLNTEADALKAQASAARGAADANYAVTDATDAYTKFLGTLGQAIKDTKGDQTAINALYREGTGLAASQADAVLTLAAQQAAANGTTVTATAAQDMWNNAMLYSANSAGPAQRAEILRYIAQANNIPATKVTEIQALLDQGKYDEALAMITDASKTRTANVVVDADQASIDETNRQIAAVAEKKRIALIQIATSNYTGPKSEGKASGDPSWRGGTVLAGEDPTRPGSTGELIDLPAGSVIHSNAESRSMLRGGRSGPLFGDVHVYNQTDWQGFLQVANMKLAGVG